MDSIKQAAGQTDVTFQTLIKQAADQADITFRTYSGRGMGGRRCIAITGTMSEMLVLIATVIKQATQELFEMAIDCDEGDENIAYSENDQVQNLIDAIMEYECDSMGMSTVLYWPNIEPEAAY